MGTDKSFAIALETICVGAAAPVDHSMPASLVTYNRFWLTKGTASDQFAAIDALWGLSPTPLAVSACKP